MEKITLLYGTSLWEGITYHSAMSGWFGESCALEQTGMFHIIFFNYYDFMQGKKLKIGVSECIQLLRSLASMTKQGTSRALNRKNGIIRRFCGVLIWMRSITGG